MSNISNMSNMSKVYNMSNISYMSKISNMYNKGHFKKKVDHRFFNFHPKYLSFIWSVWDCCVLKITQTLTNDLKWHANTEAMVKKAYSRLWMIRRLKKHGANLIDLKDVFLKQIRSILEFVCLSGIQDWLKWKPWT